MSEGLKISDLEFPPDLVAFVEGMAKQSKPAECGCGHNCTKCGKKIEPATDGHPADPEKYYGGFAQSSQTPSTMPFSESALSAKHFREPDPATEEVASKKKPRYRTKSKLLTSLLGRIKK